MEGNSVNSSRGSAQIRRPRRVVKHSVQHRSTDSRLIHLAKVAVEWKTEIGKCLEDSGVETVHRVRTGTRRVEAILDVLMREAAAENPALNQAAAKWRRELKKIRRAAAPVRDLDVHRQLLETFAGVGKAGAKEHARMEQSEVEKQASTPESKDALQIQAERLDVWLKHAREHHGEELARQIRKRLGKLDALAADFASAWQAQRGRRRAPPDAALEALDAIVRLSDQMPMLDAGNLHDFRKGAKKARYVTEAGGADAHAKAVGRAIKKIQDAIGEWHDWLCLAGEARVALGGEGQELSAMLSAEVDRSFQAAKLTTERMRGRLAGEWRAQHPHGRAVL